MHLVVGGTLNCASEQQIKDDLDVKNETIVMVMGGGDIYKLADHH